jgi:hypothetical protein
MRYNEKVFKAISYTLVYKYLKLCFTIGGEMGYRDNGRCDNCNYVLRQSRANGLVKAFVCLRCGLAKEIRPQPYESVMSFAKRLIKKQTVPTQE